MAEGDQELVKVMELHDFVNFSVPVDWWPPIEEHRQVSVVDGLGFFWDFTINQTTYVFENPADKTVNCTSNRLIDKSGWQRFVESKQLKFGDRIVLEAQQVQTFSGLRYRLRAQTFRNSRWEDV